MKSTAVVNLLFAVLIAISFSGQSGASRLSEREIALLERLESATEVEKRAGMEYLSGKGATRLISRS